MCNIDWLIILFKFFKKNSVSLLGYFLIFFYYSDMDLPKDHTEAMDSDNDDPGFGEEEHENGIVDSEVFDAAVPIESEENDLHDDTNEYENQAEERQTSEEELNKDVESFCAVDNKPEEVIVFDDDKEEKDNDSGTVSDTEQSDAVELKENPVIPPRVISIVSKLFGFYYYSYYLSEL